MEDNIYQKYLEQLRRQSPEQVEFKTTMNYRLLGRTNRYYMSRFYMEIVDKIRGRQSRSEIIENLMVIAINSPIFDNLKKDNDEYERYYMTEKLNSDFVKKAKSLGYSSGKRFLEDILDEMKG